MKTDQLCSSLQSSLSNTMQNEFIDMNHIHAAVLIPIVKVEEELGVLFEVRSADLFWQPGDICFPGGHIEQKDHSIEATAVRETSEELNISPQNIRIIGKMPPFVSVIGVTLYPFIGYINQQEFSPNLSEVAETFVIPLSEIKKIDPVVGIMEVATRPAEKFPISLLPIGYNTDWKFRTNYEVKFYRYHNHVIWGLTAIVLSNFLNLLTGKD